MKLHASSHPTPAYSASIPRMESLQRPTISLARNSEEWWYFTIRWGEYRDGCRLAGQDVVIQLLECCTEELRKDLVRTAGRSLAKKKLEIEVRQEIKKLAVLKENNMIARAILHNMHQQQHETIRSFSARIRGQANTCNFMHHILSSQVVLLP